ncbi:GNAT family N-acetyltransferase [Nibricoccus aquaticus]|uniref:GNAT family N-acetyltransferase n=1 Tax=Nibricoccus aquaticus TaxID=2576891 RepID=A0A290QCE4_9BACT|nr:GNAT family N-acetyltransferase [Nibricoccus aquaticus]ATC64880.1 GNAT family N-acetyltransferase [Nibricoccus aquaticus]
MSDDAPNVFTWIEAGAADEDTVLSLMRAFYAEERLVFSEVEARVAVRELLARPELGRVFLLSESQGGEGSRAAYGHLVLTFGFSLEFRGRFVLLDEVFVGAELRGKGFGKEAVEFAATWARTQGVAALRLEVNRANGHAREVYLRRGFGDDRRDLMTRWVGRGK